MLANQSDPDRSSPGTMDVRGDPGHDTFKKRLLGLDCQRHDTSTVVNPPPKCRFTKSRRRIRGLQLVNRKPR